jgi:hypothetical protein
VKVRIRTTPREAEVDGVKLDGLTPGSIREVSSTIGLWLVAEGYAVPEMRSEEREEGFSDYENSETSRR